MGREITTEKAGKYRYQLTQMGYKDNRRVARRISSIIGPALGTILGDTPEGDLSNFDIGDVKLSAVGAAFSDLFRNLSDADFDFLVEKFAPTTLVETVPDSGKFLAMEGQMENLFAGELEESFAWFCLCLRHNYAGFFSETGFLASTFQALKTKKPSTSPNTSTTTSSD